MGEAISIIPQSLVFNHGSTILTMERKIQTKTKYLETARHSSTPVIPARESLRQNYEFETLKHTVRPYLKKQLNSKRVERFSRAWKYLGG